MVARVKCIMPGCSSSKAKRGNLRFFTFPPRGSYLYKKWIQACRLTQIVTKCPRICSRHFENGAQMRLDKHAIPTLNLPDQDAETVKKVKLKTKCSIPNCVNRRMTNSGVKFFRFPEKGSKRFNQWADVCGLSEFDRSRKTNIACSKHFKKSEYGLRYLRHNAMPSLFLNAENMCKDQPNRNGNNSISEVNISDDKHSIQLEFVRNFQKSFHTMTRSDMEEFVLQKVVEAIVNKSEIAELRKTVEEQEIALNTFCSKITHLNKQFRDLEMTHLKLVGDLQTHNGQIVTPIRIMRTVGLQVNMNQKDSFVDFVSTESNPKTTKSDTQRPPLSAVIETQTPEDKSPLLQETTTDPKDKEVTPARLTAPPQTITTFPSNTVQINSIVPPKSTANSSTIQSQDPSITTQSKQSTLLRRALSRSPIGLVVPPADIPCQTQTMPSTASSEPAKQKSSQRSAKQVCHYSKQNVQSSQNENEQPLDTTPHPKISVSNKSNDDLCPPLPMPTGHESTSAKVGVHPPSAIPNVNTFSQTLPSNSSTARLNLNTPKQNIKPLIKRPFEFIQNDKVVQTAAFIAQPKKLCLAKKSPFDTHLQPQLMVTLGQPPLTPGCSSSGTAISVKLPEITIRRLSLQNDKYRGQGTTTNTQPKDLNCTNHQNIIKPTSNIPTSVSSVHQPNSARFMESIPNALPTQKKSSPSTNRWPKTIDLTGEEDLAEHGKMSKILKSNNKRTTPNISQTNLPPSIPSLVEPTAPPQRPQQQLNKKTDSQCHQPNANASSSAVISLVPQHKLIKPSVPSSSLGPITIDVDDISRRKNTTLLEHCNILNGNLMVFRN